MIKRPLPSKKMDTRQKQIVANQATNYVGICPSPMYISIDEGQERIHGHTNIITAGNYKNIISIPSLNYCLKVIT